METTISKSKYELYTQIYKDFCAIHTIITYSTETAAVYRGWRLTVVARTSHTSLLPQLSRGGSLFGGAGGVNQKTGSKGRRRRSATASVMNGLTHGLSRLFSRRSERSTQQATEIGLPTDVRQHVHVSKNHLTGDLEGLPAAWRRLVDAQLTLAEREDHPDAAYQAVKFYNYSIKKKEPIEPFKPLLTEEAFSEESRRIDQLLNDKNARDRDSNTSTAPSSDDQDEYLEPIPIIEEPPERPPLIARRSAPPIPTATSYVIKSSQSDRPLNKAAGLTDLTTIEEDGDSSPVLRKKEKMYASLSDDEIYEELRKICNSEDPHGRFQRLKDVGTGASGQYQFIHTHFTQHASITLSFITVLM